MTAFPEDADSSAMRRLRDGEDLALNEIMERWQSRVTSYLLRLTRSETVASIWLRKRSCGSINPENATVLSQNFRPGFLLSHPIWLESIFAG